MKKQQPMGELESNPENRIALFQRKEVRRSDDLLRRIDQSLRAFTAVDHDSFAVARLNEPPEPSPGLSAAMPWVSAPQIIPRPEWAREA